MDLTFSFNSLLSLTILLLLLPILIIYYQNKSKKPTQNGLNPYPILGTLPHFIKNRDRFIEWTCEILINNPIHTITLKSPIGANGIITSDPRNVEHMLKNNFENYPRGNRSLSFLQDFLGHGIFNSDGENWKKQRKTASLEFNKRSLRNFVMDTVRHEIDDRLIPFLTKAATMNEVVELQDVLERFGFDNICQVAFGEDPGYLSVDREDSHDFMRAFGDAQNLITARFMGAIEVMWKIKRFFNIGSEKKLKESISIVHDFATRIIKLRKERLEDSVDEDMLSRFSLNKEYSEELLRDIVISFILAGRETTSTALTWFFWMLSTQPDVKNRILEEIKNIRIKTQNMKTFTLDELRELNYLHAAISECLRLYPPVAIDTQSCRDDDIMPDGTFVGKNWFVTYSAYAMGRMESIWGKDCENYKPERWLDVSGDYKPESPFKFPVFHAGPRTCLGKEMAYIQMKSIVVNVLERFEIEVVEKREKPEPLLVFTMKMKGGLQVRVKERA